MRWGPVAARAAAGHLGNAWSRLPKPRCAAGCSARKSLRRPLDVELRAVPAITVAAVEDDVEYDSVVDWYAGAMAELDAVVRESTGVPGGLYDNALFEAGRG